jgi:hypothetical protein
MKNYIGVSLIVLAFIVCLGSIYNCNALRRERIVTPQNKAFELKEDGATAVEVAQVLMSDFGLNKADELALILKDATFNASQIAAMLKKVFIVSVNDIENILKATGFTNEQAFIATSQFLAKKFAPQLRFDKAASTFPMSAQDYYNKVIETGLYNKRFNCDCFSKEFPDNNKANCKSRAYHNTDRQSPTSGQYTSKVWQDDELSWAPNGNAVKIPTYFKAFECGRQIRIVYWWFYGWQENCSPNYYSGQVSYHHADWERILVTLSEDESRVAAVTYFQHSGWYTRLAEGGDRNRFAGANYKPGFEKFEINHPVVYVGKRQHGSYHNEGGTGVSGISFCSYFQDYRHNERNQDLWLNTWNYLVSLEDGAEQWMAHEADPDLNFRWGACKGPIEDGKDHGCSISQHPVETSSVEYFCNIKACNGLSSIVTDKTGIPIGAAISGTPSGCFESQCEYHDNQTGWTQAHPGTCSHCPPGYTDAGIKCGKGDWYNPRSWKTTSIHYYGLDYKISHSDYGLLKSQE